MVSHDEESHIQLPADILYFIFSHVNDQSTLRQCRLVSHAACSVATRWLFRHLRLSAKEGEADRFLQVAKSEALRCHAKTVSIDTDTGFEYGSNSNYQVPETLMRAVEYLRFFSNLNELRVRFSEHCGGDDYEDRTWTAVEETHDFRYRILRTVFECLAGTWTREFQAEIDEEVNLDWDFDNINGEWEEELDDTLMPALPVKAIQVTNLEAFDDERLTTSEAFRAIIDSGAITSLKLYIIIEQHESGEYTFNQHYDFFDNLQKTWLTPSLAANLRVLSIYCRDNWGLCPKMDFRAVNPSQGGFPKLQVLSLCSYTISHDWQIDWIINQGKENGGLKELHLLDCAVASKCFMVSPVDDGTTVVGQDADGNDMVVSNAGYPRTSVLKNYRGDGGLDKVEYTLRWYGILGKLGESMHSLGKFWAGPLGEEDEDDPESDDLFDFDYQTTINQFLQGNVDEVLLYGELGGVGMCKNNCLETEDIGDADYEALKLLVTKVESR